MIFDQLSCSRASEGMHCSVMNAQNCILKILIVFQILDRYTETPSLLAIDSPTVRFMKLLIRKESGGFFCLSLTVGQISEHVGTEPLLYQLLPKLFSILAELQ
ncbi:hypothetical protein [Planomonospora venezuelensis]|uniref:Uncharacterized protein n=1 Tax=Planomonospora venezuelensis TaxID=1999 RepID=A0A841CW15_PLAVE|nr:hypothetical protein [Planomonospora venezuelensis]MBB5961499.1 hypothetical protein [Planomonospora venezuelensis]